MINTKQTTNHIMMVRPAHFGFNSETALNNAFQVNDRKVPKDEVETKALEEFDAFVLKLKNAGVDVLVVQDTEKPVKPDAVFPNNWVSFHDSGSVYLYPIFAKTRRQEKRQEILDLIKGQYKINKIIDLSYYEESNIFLEGTGSMIFDRTHKIVYACLSPRTSDSALDDYCQKTNYKKIVFTSKDQNGQAIYHTNVMMSIGEKFAIICLDSVLDYSEKRLIEKTLLDSGKEIIEISLEQVNKFAGNMLEVQSKSGKSILAMSEQAYKSLKKSQIEAIEKYSEILYTDLGTIEKFGGGSARCMLAEIFLPQN